MLVGSYYVDVRTLNSEVPQNVITEDLIITRDALGKDFVFFFKPFLNSILISQGTKEKKAR